MKRKNVTAVILMAGNSSRFGKGYNKNLEKIYDKPVFVYSLEAFEKNENISSIIVVAKREEIEIIKKQIKDRKEKEILVILGGNSRKESVTNALNYVKTKDVIIQDGARPNIKQEYIDKCIEARQEYKGCAIAIKSKDTVKITDDNGIVLQTTNRKNTWLVQTPQCFEKGILWKVHQKIEMKK